MRSSKRWNKFIYYFSFIILEINKGRCGYLLHRGDEVDHFAELVKQAGVVMDSPAHFMFAWPSDPVCFECLLSACKCSIFGFRAAGEQQWLANTGFCSCKTFGSGCDYSEWRTRDVGELNNVLGGNTLYIMLQVLGSLLGLKSCPRRTRQAPSDWMRNIILWSHHRCSTVLIQRLAGLQSETCPKATWVLFKLCFRSLSQSQISWTLWALFLQGHLSAWLHSSFRKLSSVSRSCLWEATRSVKLPPRLFSIGKQGGKCASRDKTNYPTRVSLLHKLYNNKLPLQPKFLRHCTEKIQRATDTFKMGSDACLV